MLYFRARCPERQARGVQARIARAEVLPDFGYQDRRISTAFRPPAAPDEPRFR
jgi:hypothetical protein